VAIDSYVNSITSEHIDKPNFIAWLSSSLNIVEGMYLVLAAMDSNFDINNAIGVQLDVLGEIIGVSRLLTFQPLNGNNPIMDDETYKLVLRAKIAKSNWQGTTPQIYEIWNNVFHNSILLRLQDNQDMSVNAYVIGYVSQIRQDLIQQGYIIPKPEGVKLNYITPSVIPFVPYLGMIVSVIQTSVITMDNVTYY